VPCKWNFLFPSVTCVVYSVVAFNVSLTLLCDDAKFKINKKDKNSINSNIQPSLHIHQTSGTQNQQLNTAA